MPPCRSCRYAPTSSPRCGTSSGRPPRACSSTASPAAEQVLHTTPRSSADSSVARAASVVTERGVSSTWATCRTAARSLCWATRSSASHATAMCHLLAAPRILGTPSASSCFSRCAPSLQPVQSEGLADWCAALRAQVDSAHERRGYGKALVAFAEREAADENVAWLLVR